MNKKIILILLLSGFIPYATVAHSKSPEEMLEEEKKEAGAKDDYLESMKLFPVAIKRGKQTVKSLEANLKHIERLENDPAYKDCVAIKEKIKNQISLENKMAEQVSQGKMTKSSYDAFMEDGKVEKDDYQQQLKSKKCH